MYDWHQTPQTITLSIPLSYKIDSKKVDTTISKNFIKLNIPEMKIFKLIDLFDEIDIDHSSILIEDNKIIFYLNKTKEENWPQLEYKSTNKEEIKERRKHAEEELNKKISEMRETASNKKKEFEKFVMERSMKIEDEKRKELDQKKNLERNQAENELYEFINDIEKKGANVDEKMRNIYKIEGEDEDDIGREMQNVNMNLIHNPNLKEVNGNNSNYYFNRIIFIKLFLGDLKKVNATTDLSSQRVNQSESEYESIREKNNNDSNLNNNREYIKKDKKIEKVSILKENEHNETPPVIDMRNKVKDNEIFDT
jgi:hypothetical protein